MTLIQYRGAIAAIATERNVRFAPAFEDLRTDDPDRRFVYAMALFARDILTGELAGPYTDAAAEEYARAFLGLDDERETEELRRTAYDAWKEGGGPGRHDLDDLALRAAAQHAQVVGDTSTEREINGLLAVREAKHGAR
jgi:hypothetical protein